MARTRVCNGMDSVAEWVADGTDNVLRQKDGFRDWGKAVVAHAVMVLVGGKTLTIGLHWLPLVMRHMYTCRVVPMMRSTPLDGGNRTTRGICVRTDMRRGQFDAYEGFIHKLTSIQGFQSNVPAILHLKPFRRNLS